MSGFYHQNLQRKKLIKQEGVKSYIKKSFYYIPILHILHLNIVGIVYISSIDGRPRCKDRFPFHALFHVLYNGMGDIRINNIRDTINNK